MNASTCECQAKKTLFSGLKISIYPFFLTMVIAIFFLHLGNEEIVKENITGVNVKFGVVTGAVLVVIASIFRVLYQGKGRDRFINAIIYLSNIATDLGYGAVGFYVGSEIVKNGFVINTVMWLSGSILYWVLLNILYSTSVVDNIPSKLRPTLVYISIGILLIGYASYFFLK